MDQRVDTALERLTIVTDIAQQMGIPAATAAPGLPYFTVKAWAKDNAKAERLLSHFLEAFAQSLKRKGVTSIIWRMRPEIKRENGRVKLMMRMAVLPDYVNARLYAKSNEGEMGIEL